MRLLFLLFATWLPHGCFAFSVLPSRVVRQSSRTQLLNGLRLFIPDPDEGSDAYMQNRGGGKQVPYRFISDGSVPYNQQPNVQPTGPVPYYQPQDYMDHGGGRQVPYRYTSDVSSPYNQQPNAQHNARGPQYPQQDYMGQPGGGRQVPYTYTSDGSAPYNQQRNAQPNAPGPQYPPQGYREQHGGGQQLPYTYRSDGAYSTPAAAAAAPVTHYPPGDFTTLGDYVQDDWWRLRDQSVKQIYTNLNIGTLKSSTDGDIAWVQGVLRVDLRLFLYTGRVELFDEKPEGGRMVKGVGMVPHGIETPTRTARNLEHVVDVAQYAARQAGAIMLETTGRIDIMGHKANAKDLVTESDIACQRLIEKHLTQAFPDDAFLGEESVEAGSEASHAALTKALSEADGEVDRLLFIVDPIDGTTNFQAGLPIFCVSIGVVHLPSQQVVAGVIYNPALQEMMSAIQGQGAYLNGKRLEIPSAAVGTNNAGELVQQREHVKLAQSLVNVGFPVVKESTIQASCKAVAALGTRVRGLRMMACASQVMSWVAQDTFQVYTSWDLNAWDVAAGIIIVREAGGSVMDFKGEAATIAGSRDLIITSPTGGEVLGEELRAIMEEAGCMMYE